MGLMPVKLKSNELNVVLIAGMVTDVDESDWTDRNGNTRQNRRFEIVGIRYELSKGTPFPTPFTPICARARTNQYGQGPKFLEVFDWELAQVEQVK